MNVDSVLLDAIAMRLGAAPRFDLACIGTSIHGLGAFTFESLACLASADLVYYYPPSAEHHDFMKRINNKVVNLNETIYIKGAEFDPSYREIVTEVMRSLHSGKKIAYAVQGSPAFHCGTAVRLQRLALQQGFTAIMISGVSSFELLSAELSKSYDVTNIQIYSANRIAEGSLSFDTRAPCLLFDIGRYALPAVRESASNFLRLKLAVLAKRVRSTYPRDHTILLMQITTSGICRSSRTTPLEFEDSLTRVEPVSRYFYLQYASSVALLEIGMPTRAPPSLRESGESKLLAYGYPTVVFSSCQVNSLLDTEEGMGRLDTGAPPGSVDHIAKNEQYAKRRCLDYDLRKMSLGRPT